MYLFSGLQGVLGVDQAAGDQLALERVQLVTMLTLDLIELLLQLLDVLFGERPVQVHLVDRVA